MNISIGYQISNTVVEEKRALDKAFELIRKTRHLGVEMREWVKKSQWESNALLIRINKDKGATSSMKLWEIACLEGKIITALRSYMNETSELMNALKPLNPPLCTDQIKPFMEAMISDRNVTVQAMDPLTKTVGELVLYKTRHLSSPDLNASFGYNPSF